MMTAREFQERVNKIRLDGPGESFTRITVDAFRSMSIYGDSVTRKLAAAWLAKVQELKLV